MLQQHLSSVIKKKTGRTFHAIICDGTCITIIFHTLFYENIYSSQLLCCVGLNVTRVLLGDHKRELRLRDDDGQQGQNMK